MNQLAQSQVNLYQPEALYKNPQIECNNIASFFKDSKKLHYEYQVNTGDIFTQYENTDFLIPNLSILRVVPYFQGGIALNEFKEFEIKPTKLPTVDKYHLILGDNTGEFVCRYYVEEKDVSHISLVTDKTIDAIINKISEKKIVLKNKK